jgi:hypothetical protein
MQPVLRHAVPASARPRDLARPPGPRDTGAADVLAQIAARRPLQLQGRM